MQDLSEVKTYIIDLDLKPEIRWKKVIDDYKEPIMAALNEIKKVVDPHFNKMVEYFLKFLAKLNMISYSNEI